MATPPKPPPPTDLRLIRLMRRAALLARATLLDDTELSPRDRARVAAGIVKPGTTEAAKKHNKARAAAQLRDLGKELRALNIQADRVIDESVRGAYQRGVRDADRLARAAGLADAGTPVSGALSGAETRRAAVLVRRAQADVGKAFRSIEAVTGRSVRQARALGLNNEKVSRILAGGTITGQSPLVVQQLRKHLQQISIDGFVEVPTRTGGVIRFKPDYYADLVYQTAMAEAHNIAELERLIAREAYYVQIIGSNSTNFCTAFVGKVFYIGPGEDPLGLYPHIRTLPRGGAPFHPRCTKRYVPFNPKLASPAEIDAGKMDEQTRQLLDKSPAEAEKIHQEAKAEPETPEVRQPAPDVRAQAADARRQLREIGEGTAATAHRLAAEREALQRPMREAIEIGDATAIAELDAQEDKIVGQMLALQKERVQAARDVLAAKNSATVELKTTLRGKRRKLVEEAAAEVGKLVDRDLLAKIMVVAGPLERGRRARSYYKGGKIYMSPSAPVDVGIHEIGHLIEDASPTLHQAALAFLDRRTKGEQLQKLRKLTGVRGYKANEEAWPDEFFNPYVGKNYGRRYTEIISMGLQYLWRDPVKFAAEDPDFFEFLFRVLRGDIR